MKKLFLFFVFLLTALPTYAQGVELIRHAFALHGEPKYEEGFDHFDYVNPKAPKGGSIVLSATGTFDSVNPFILKGVAADGVAGFVFDTLMTPSQDEASVNYGLIAEGMRIAQDHLSVTFYINKNARFQDGSPITADDVIFSFRALQEKGRPFYRAYYADVKDVEKIGSHEVTFHFTTAENKELPLILGQMPVFSSAYYTAVAFDQTTLEAPVGSGPYRITNVNPGRSITFERVKDYWAEYLNVNRGKNNVDQIRIDYYRDRNVAFEAFKSGEFDFFQENVAKRWATGYDFPAVQDGRVIKSEISHELPTGLQGFVYNTRRPVFQDKRVREALAYAFDFGWTNVNLFNGAYTRTTSYFSNSELASQGLPSVGELALLEPFRDRLSPEVFTEIYTPPSTDGTGQQRQNLETAWELLKTAGYTLNDQNVLVKDGTPLSFEILLVSPDFERIVMPFKKSLERLGIQVNVRTVDSAQYEKRLNEFDFDMIVHVWGQSLSPGNEQRNYWSSVAADLNGTQNFAGIKDPVVDALIDRIIMAPDRASLVNATRAIDRVLLNGHYVIPHWHVSSFRIAYWDMFGMPAVTPKYALGFPEIWWVDAEKYEALSNQKTDTHDHDHAHGDDHGVDEHHEETSYLVPVLLGLGFMVLIGIIIWYQRRPRQINDPDDDNVSP